MKKNWKYEIARDLMAFGSILFYLIVLVRSTIGEHKIFVYQLLVAAVVLILLSLIIKNSNYYISRAFVLVVFTSLFYKDIPFTIFASLLWIFMIGAAFYIKETKESVTKGVVLGVIATIISYYFSLVIG